MHWKSIVYNKLCNRSLLYVSYKVSLVISPLVVAVGCPVKELVEQVLVGLVLWVHYLVRVYDGAERELVFPQSQLNFNVVRIEVADNVNTGTKLQVFHIPETFHDRSLFLTYV